LSPTEMASPIPRVPPVTTATLAIFFSSVGWMFPVD
jgi:hypothetical protein